MDILGYDTDGITQKSLEALEMYVNHPLEKVLIDLSSGQCLVYFVFHGDGAYKASGFSIGYGGEGPNGLHKAIRMFYPDKLNPDFWKTPIASLHGKKYEWTPENSFQAI